MSSDLMLLKEIEGLPVYAGVVTLPVGAPQDYFTLIRVARAVPELPPVMPFSGEGIDVSRWQGAVDWAKVKGAGYGWAYARASMGKTGVDEQFARNWSEMKQAGIKRGAYHYLIADVDGRAQAEHFAKTLKGDWGELPPVLDIEPRKVASGEYENPLKTLVEKYVADWLAEIEGQTGKRPMVYTNRWALEWLTNSPTWLGEFELWVAAYRAIQPALSELPMPWREQGWRLWQYSSTGKVAGIAGAVDLNRAKG